MAFAGVSLVVNGKLCASTKSVVDSGADSGYHLLVVEGYSRTKETTPYMECIQSRPFIVGGRSWVVKYYPNGQDSISVLLVQDECVYHKVHAHVAFRFIDQPNIIRQNQPCCFFYDDSSLVDQPGRFVTREAFERSSHLKNDSFVLRCDVVILEEKDVESDEEDEPPRPFIKLPPTDFATHFSDMLLTEDGADITFEVGGKKLSAHRCVLAARSTVFKTQLYGAISKGAVAPSVVKIDGIEANVLAGLLTFIYTDGMPDFKDEFHVWLLNCDSDERRATWLLQLLEAAERYDLQKLKLICEEKLANLIRKDMVACTIVVAERRQCRWLKEACLEFIKTHTSLHRDFTADGQEKIIRTCCPSILEQLISTFALQEGAAVGAVVEGANDTGAGGKAEWRQCRWLKEACLEFIKTHTSLHRDFTADGLEKIIRTWRPSVLEQLISTFALQEGAAVGAVVEGANDTGAGGQAEDQRRT